MATEPDTQSTPATVPATTDPDATDERLASQPVRAQRVFVPAARLMQCLVGENRVRISNLSFDCVKIVATEFDRKQNGVWLTIESGMFSPVSIGTPIPEFRAEWLRDPRCQN